MAITLKEKKMDSTNYFTGGIFESLAADDSDSRTSHRKTLAVANKRVADRFGAFLAAANSPSDRDARLDLIRGDLREVIASVCNEYGGDPDRVERSLVSHFLAGTEHLAPGDKHLPAASPKRNRQYEHIKEDCQKRGKSEDECKELAARTVNKQRAEHGETKDSAHDPFGFGDAINTDRVNSLSPDELDQAGHALRNIPGTDSAVCRSCGGPLSSQDHYCPSCHEPTRGDQDQDMYEQYPQDQSSSGYELGGEAGPYQASTREARRPKMCPYHNEVTDIALASGDPSAGFNAMAQHAWGANHCQGEYEGGCNFKREMVTQTYWDQKAEQAQQRRDDRARQLEIDQQVQETEIPDSPEGLEDSPAPLEEGSLDSQLQDAPSAVGGPSEAEMGSLEPMAASTHQGAPQIPGQPGFDPLFAPATPMQPISPAFNPNLQSPTPTPQVPNALMNPAPFQNVGPPTMHEQLSDLVNAGQGSHPQPQGQQPAPHPQGQPGASPQHLQPGQPPANFQGTDYNYNHLHGRPVQDFAHPQQALQQSYRNNLRNTKAGQKAIDLMKEAEALKTIEVDQGSDQDGSPKIDKGTWNPSDRGQSGKPIDTEGEGSPHPTERVDPLVPLKRENEEADFLKGTDAVTETQDVEQASKFDGDKADSGSWKGNNGASPVTSGIDPNVNPIRQLLEDGFVPHTQVQAAIADWEADRTRGDPVPTLSLQA